MSLVHAVRAIYDEFLGSQTFDELRDFLGPFNRYIFTTNYWATEFITSLVSKNCRIFGVCEASVRIFVGQKMLYIVFKVLNDSFIGVELHDKRGIVTCREVETSEAQEIILSTVVVILFPLVSVCRRNSCPIHSDFHIRLLVKTSNEMVAHIIVDQWRHDSQTMLACLIDRPVYGIKCLLIIHP